MLSLEVVDAAASINEASIESTLNGGFNLNGTELCYEADTWSQSFAVFRVKKYLWIHHLRLLHPGTEDGLIRAIDVTICSRSQCEKPHCESQIVTQNHPVWLYFKCGHPGDLIVIRFSINKSFCRLEAYGYEIE
ncbi:uncharacterized protein LOC142340767 [Convolutriloba macropyga]|uniref:uncharacterized protein LOC142340767 n=1 Tax=Convolutriloba macropyga TaxID=536237 RepID=UPI003F528881